MLLCYVKFHMSNLKNHFPGLHPPIHEPHTRPFNNPCSGRRGHGRHPDIRLSILVRALREDQTRD